MNIRVRKFLLCAAVGALLCGVAAPRARAIDPVTMAILAPVALKTAQVAWPYVLRGLQCGALQMLTMGKDVLDIFRLPIGVLQSTLGAPVGMFSSGVSNLVQGGIAPFKLVWDTLVLPVAFLGINPLGG